MPNSLPAFGPRPIRTRRRDSTLGALEAFRSEAPEVTLGQVLSFLYIAQHENISVVDLAAVSRTSKATASRAARSLFARGDRGAREPFLGWVEFGTAERRGNIKALKLTDAGRRLQERIDILITEAVPIRQDTDLTQ